MLLTTFLGLTVVDTSCFEHWTSIGFPLAVVLRITSWNRTYVMSATFPLQRMLELLKSLDLTVSNCRFKQRSNGGVYIFYWDQKIAEQNCRFIFVCFSFSPLSVSDVVGFTFISFCWLRVPQSNLTNSLSQFFLSTLNFWNDSKHLLHSHSASPHSRLIDTGLWGGFFDEKGMAELGQNELKSFFCVRRLTVCLKLHMCYFSNLTIKSRFRLAITVDRAGCMFHFDLHPTRNQIVEVFVEMSYFTK